MVARRPLVRVAGRTRQLPAGDVLAGNAQILPVYQAGGALVKVKVLDAVLNVYLISGAAVGVPCNV